MLTKVHNRMIAGSPLNFFDFLGNRTPAEISQIIDGTFTGDLAVEWTAFRDALAAQSAAGIRPHGIIPQCTIRTSASPNFAIDFLRLETHGLPHVRKIGGGTAMVFDGRGLGLNGFGVRRLSIDPLEATSETGNSGWQVYWCQMSTFRNMQSLGGSFAAFDIRSCVTSYFECPTASAQPEDWVNRPDVVMYVGSITGNTINGPSDMQCSWCTFMNPVLEYGKDAGLFMERAIGNLVMGGTAEGNGFGGVGLGRGLVMATADCRYNKIIGGTYEFNTGLDIFVFGAVQNGFTDVDTSTGGFSIENTARYNNVRGGKGVIIELDATTFLNTVTEVNYLTVTDLSSGVDANRCYNNSGAAFGLAWHDTDVQSTPAVTTTVGTLTNATAVMRHSLTANGSVQFSVTVTITDNGTGAGQLTLSLPFDARRKNTFTGTIDTIGSAVVADVIAGLGVLRIRNLDGTYPGATGRIITVSGIYERD